MIFNPKQRGVRADQQKRIDAAKEHGRKAALGRWSKAGAMPEHNPSKAGAMPETMPKNASSPISPLPSPITTFIGEDAQMTGRAKRLVERMERCKAVLGRGEVATNHQQWLDRCEDYPKVMDSVLAETESAKREGKINKTPGAYAADLFSRWSTKTQGN